MERIKFNKPDLEKAIKENMKKVRDAGLLAGSKAICGVVLEKAKNNKKSEHDRLQDIIDFCERSLGVAQKHGEELNG